MRKHIPEILLEADKAPSKAERIRVLQSNNVRPLRTILALAFDKNIVLDIPEGAPPFKRDEREPVGMSSASLYTESRRLARLLPSDPLNKTRKEMIFIQMLEGIHFSEADALIKAKDKKLEEMYPNITREIVRKAFPTLLTDVQPNQFSKKDEDE
jgi:hypothetical protein